MALEPIGEILKRWFAELAKRVEKANREKEDKAA